MTADDTATFAELLQNHRLAQSLTQEELAEKARLSARAISDLERGVKLRPHSATVRQLADALQLSLDEKAAFQGAARQTLSRGRPEQPSDSMSSVRTFLFADLRGYTEFTVTNGDEAAARVVEQFSNVVVEVVSAWDGEAIEYQGDRAVAVFQSARQALRSALEMQQRFARIPEDILPLKVGVGLDAGEAVVSAVAGYHGTALNLAARLCDCARPGEVLATEGVIHLVGKVDGIRYVEQPSRKLKGFADPVTPILVTAIERPSPEAAEAEPAETDQRLPVGGFLGSLPAGPLVAHDEDVAVLRHVVETVAAGQGRLTLIAGEAGIGKTRLAQEVTRIAHDRGFIVAAGRSYEPQRSIPYYPFLDALDAIFAAAPRALQDEAEHRWPYLSRVLPDRFGSAPAALSSSLEEQERLFRAVAGFVQAVAEERPVAILLDDLHWSDSASLQLLHYLARQTRAVPVLLVGTYRDVEVNPDHPLEAALRDLGREQLVERVMLRRLGEKETGDFIADTMGTVEAGQDLIALVHRQTDGNPFFTQQIVQELIENGTLYREDGLWKGRAIGEIEVPESIRSVIAQRISRLEDSAQEILQEASVLGPAFSFDDLLAMKSVGGDEREMEDHVDDALTNAAQVGIVRVTSRDDYVFDHALTQHALYASLSPRRRRRLHLAAGEALEGLPQRRRNQRASELAWHFLQSDDEERAARYSLLAGDQAESVFAHDEAERQYRTALELVPDLDDAAWEGEAIERLGVVLRTMGRYDEALGLLERAARMQHAAGNMDGEGRVVAQIGLLCSLSGEAASGIRRVRPLVEALENGPPTRSLALLYSALIRLYNFIDSETDQLEITPRFLALARALGDDRLLAEAEAHHGVSLMHLGQYEEALRLLESAIPRAERAGDLHTVCLGLDFASLIYHAWHQVEKTRAYRDRSMEVAERLGDPREISHRAIEAAYVTFLVGDWEAARRYAERALTSAMEMDNLRAFVQPLYSLAELALYTGVGEEAAGYLRDSMTIAQHLGLTSHRREVQALLAEKDVLEGNVQAGLDRVHSVLATDGWEEHPTFLASYATVCVEAGDLHAAQDAVIKAVAVATEQRLPVVLTDVRRVQGTIARERGAWAEAASHLEQAIHQARDIVYPWGEARALYECALLYSRQGDHDRARERLDAASTIFRRLGAGPYLARVERVAAELVTPPPSPH